MCTCMCVVYACVYMCIYYSCGAACECAHMHMYIHGPCMDALAIYHFVPELLCITCKYENLMIIAVRLHCRLCSELNTTYVSTCTHINIHTHTL